MSLGYRDARYVEEILSGEMRSRALILAHKFGLFRCISGRVVSAESMAQELGILNVVMLKKLLRVLEGLDLVQSTNDGYVNTPAAERALIPESPTYIGAMIDFFADQYVHKTTLRLYEILKNNRVLVERPTQVEWENYLSGMACVARLSASKIAEALALEGVNSLLDLGGGPGSYSIAFAKAYPQLDVTLYEIEPTLRRAEIEIQNAGLSERIQRVTGSATDSDFGGPYDVIFISHVIHLFPPDVVKQMLNVARQSTRPGGRVVVREFVMNSQKSEPLLGALIGLNMWLRGDAYSYDEVKDMMEGVGLSKVDRVEVAKDGPSVIGDLVVGMQPTTQGN